MRLVKKGTLLTKLLYLHVTSFRVISIGSYSPLHTSLPGLRTSEVILWKSCR